MPKVVRTMNHGALRALRRQAEDGGWYLTSRIDDGVVTVAQRQTPRRVEPEGPAAPRTPSRRSGGGRVGQSPRRGIGHDGGVQQRATLPRHARPHTRKSTHDPGLRIERPPSRNINREVVIENNQNNPRRHCDSPRPFTANQVGLKQP